MSEILFGYEGINYLWEDCTVGFLCPKCGSRLSVDSQNGTEECECGIKYSLSWKLKIDKGNH